MCLNCKREVISHIEVGDQLETARGNEFTIEEIDTGYSGGQGRIVYETGGEGAEPKWCHINHLAKCYHWMDKEGRVIEGVGGETTNTVRELVGEDGQLAQCTKCERNPAYIWGILRAHPDVRDARGRNNLVIR